MTTPSPAYAVRSETAIFSEPVYDISIQSSNIVEHYPLSSVSDVSSPITFLIQGNDTQYIDPNHIQLYIKCKIAHEDGATKVPPHSLVGSANGDVFITIANNFLHSLFQQCTVHVNETQITSTSTLYPYRAFIETVLGFGGDYKDTQAKSAIYYDEENEGERNAQAIDRQNNVIHDSNEFEMIGKPFVDICAQTKYILPGNDIRFTFTRSSPEFYMHGNKVKFYCQIMDARLLVRKHTLLPSILTTHLKLWQSGIPLSYPMRRIEMKSYTLAQGTLQNTNENLFTGLLPDRIILALVTSASLNGLLDTSPFKFDHHKLSNITVTSNGDHTYRQSYDLDVSKKLCVQPYYHMFEALGVSGQNDGPNISLSQYNNSKLFLVYDFRGTGEGYTIPRHGTITINMKFREALQQSVTVLCHAEYPSILHIDNNKNVYFKDYFKDHSTTL